MLVTSVFAQIPQKRSKNIEKRISETEKIRKKNPKKKFFGRRNETLGIVGNAFWQSLAAIGAILEASRQSGVQ